MSLSVSARTANAEAVATADKRYGSEHDDEPPTTALNHAGMVRPSMALPSRAYSVENVIPVPSERLGRQRGEPSGQKSVVVRAHAITSVAESSAPSCWCALDKVAATVPSAIPSTSPISA